MMMGPVGEDAFAPTYSVHGIALPFSVMLWLLPVASVGHVPLAAGNIDGVVLEPLPEEPEPLELPLDPEPLELPELPLEPELPWLPELPPELTEPLPEPDALRLPEPEPERL